jgi:1-aminocyclopropane-1-carboxylate deaminase/D-cysteine desulfhydrase-like pyridoxal-dependent ACC family enzyme
MEDLNDAVASIADELRVDGRRPYVIPVGGSSPLGASAHAITAEEILDDLGHDDVLVIAATASGGPQTLEPTRITRIIARSGRLI